MKNINFHLVAVIAVLITLFSVNWQYGNETFVFFGFAENKEMEIRVDHAGTVQKIHITPGNRVKKGDVLIEITRSDIGLTQSDLSHNIAKLESQMNMWELNVRSSINELEAQKSIKKADITAQIERIESEMAINESLVSDLTSVSVAKDKTGRGPQQVRLDGLKTELLLITQPIDVEIKKLRQELSAADNPIRIQIAKLKEEQVFVQKAEQKLTIYAPNNGIVGSVFCKNGEQFPSFRNLLTFYEETPTQVKAYVLESLILNVNMGDEVTVGSGLKTDQSCNGIVVGMGSRIVEIPERLRRNPSFKTYGREIIIAIPANNNFLQKEKVILKLPIEDEVGNETAVKVSTSPS